MTELLSKLKVRTKIRSYNTKLVSIIYNKYNNSYTIIPIIYIMFLYFIVFIILIKKRLQIDNIITLIISLVYFPLLLSWSGLFCNLGGTYFFYCNLSQSNSAKKICFFKTFIFLKPILYSGSFSRSLINKF